MHINEMLSDLAKTHKLQSYFFSIMLGKAVLKELVKNDMVWAAAAGLFVFFYLSFHMRSFFLASFSILLIFFSFAITQSIYIWILGIHYF